jgi:hypothetical protein
VSTAVRHATPRWGAVVVEQIRLLALSLRPEALVVAAVLGSGAVIIVHDILTGGPGFDSRDLFPTAVISFLFPFAVWRSDTRFGSSFLWTLPVERRLLAYARVLAGGVWLTAALALFVTWLLALMLLSGVSPATILTRVPIVATIGTYLLGSALVLGLRHPLRGLIGAVGVAIVVGGVSQRLEAFYGVQTLLGSSDLYDASAGVRHTWHTLSGLTRFLLSTTLWLGAGFAALWVAASRHREHRRS